MSRRIVRRHAQMSLPSRRAAPWWGRSAVAMQRSNVDFPDPLGPVTWQATPGATWNEIRATAQRRPYRRARSSMTSPGGLSATGASPRGGAGNATVECCPPHIVGPCGNPSSRDVHRQSHPSPSEQTAGRAYGDVATGLRSLVIHVAVKVAVVAIVQGNTSCAAGGRHSVQVGPAIVVNADSVLVGRTEALGICGLDRNRVVGFSAARAAVIAANRAL